MKYCNLYWFSRPPSFAMPQNGFPIIWKKVLAGKESSFRDLHFIWNISPIQCTVSQNGSAGNRPTAVQKVATFLAGFFPSIPTYTISEGNPFSFFLKIRTQTAIGDTARANVPCRVFVLCVFPTNSTEPAENPRLRTCCAMAGGVSSLTSRNHSPTVFAKNLKGVFAVGQKISGIYS